MTDIEKSSAQKQDTAENTAKMEQKITLPVVALFLDLFPFFPIFLTSLHLEIRSFFWFVFLTAPILGLLLGVFSLTLGKKQIGTAGRIFAIIAIALPLSCIVFILIFFIGAATGLISLM